MAAGRARPPQNPMENIVILGEVFRYCDNSFESVKTRRLVCKAWKQASGPQWTCFTVPLHVIPDPPDNDSAQQEGVNKGAITVSQFVKQKGTNSQAKLAYRNLLLDGWIINNAINEHDVNIWQFWTLYGGNITVLTLKNCTFPPNYNHLFGSWFWIAVPNLEQLKVIDCQMKVCPAPAVLGVQKRNFMEFHERCVGIRGIRRRVTACKLEEGIAEVTPVIHQGLKVLHVQNVTDFLSKLTPPVALIVWSKLIEGLPSLDKLSIRSQGPDQAQSVNGKAGPLKNRHNLKCVDAIGMYENSSEMGSQKMLAIQWRQLSLHKLTLDCGFRKEAHHTKDLLELEAKTLRELHLFRAPFSSPFRHFPSARKMEDLTELQLWGNVCDNLNFLLLMPNLRVLKWNTSCYDEKSQGSHLHKKLGKVAAHAQFAANIVQNSKQLDANFQTNKMETLELYSGELDMECLKKLGKWMPQLIRLKVQVVGDYEFCEIGKQWHNLEHLELAHGSIVTADGILESHLTYKSLQMLTSFTWKPCSCIKTTFGEEESYADNELRRNAGRNVVLPWKRAFMLDLPPTACVQALFEKALRHGGTAVSEFLSALPK